MSKADKIDAIETRLEQITDISIPMRRAYEACVDGKDDVIASVLEEFLTELQDEETELLRIHFLMSDPVTGDAGRCEL